MTSVQNNQNNFLPNIFGQSLDVVLINALFNTSFACNSVTNIFLSVFKAIGKFGVIIVIKSLFSGESFKVENLFQKLVRILFYKKIVLNDQKMVSSGIGGGKIERTYEEEFQDCLDYYKCKEHPDMFFNKQSLNLIQLNQRISYLNFVYTKIRDFEKVLDEEKKINEQLKKLTNKVQTKTQNIPKPPYQRKYEKEFQETLKKYGATENPDPFANKNINGYDYNNVSYLNWVCTHKGLLYVCDEEKDMLEHQNSRPEIQTKTRKISKPPYQRKYEEGFQSFLQHKGSCPFDKRDDNETYLKYLNFYNFSYEQIEKEKNMLEDQNLESSPSESYFFYTTIKDVFSKKEDPKEPFPIYFNNNILEYLPYFHSEFIDSMKKKANQAYLESKKIPEGQTRCIKINTSGGMNTNYTPTKLFPSKNYKKLEGMITNYFEVCEITQSYEPLCVLINGVPGLGKTKFIDHFASLNIAELIGKIDMTEQFENKFDKIFSSITSPQNHQGKTIILIDELDKYLDQYIKKNIIKVEEKVEKEKDIGIKVKSSEEEIKDKKISIKEDLLYTLLRISEYDGFTYPVVILFVANNFDTIYDGIDMTHYRSLQSRFFKIVFESCDKKEIIEYLRYFNNSFINTEFHEPNIENLVKDIPENIDIVYRDLKDISFKSNYRIKEIIDSLKNLVENKN